jgi:hypothetical protein
VSCTDWPKTTFGSPLCLNAALTNPIGQAQPCVQQRSSAFIFHTKLLVSKVVCAMFVPATLLSIICPLFELEHLLFVLASSVQECGRRFLAHNEPD